MASRSRRRSRTGTPLLALTPPPRCRVPCDPRFRDSGVRRPETPRGCAPGERCLAHPLTPRRRRGVAEAERGRGQPELRPSRGAVAALVDQLGTRELVQLRDQRPLRRPDGDDAVGVAAVDDGFALGSGQRSGHRALLCGCGESDSAAPPGRSLLPADDSPRDGGTGLRVVQVGTSDPPEILPGVAAVVGPDRRRQDPPPGGLLTGDGPSGKRDSTAPGA